MNAAALAPDPSTAAPVFIPDGVFAEKVTEVQHYTDRLFRFRITRPQSFRFRSGEFVMIGLPNAEKPVFRAYSIASPSWDEEIEFFSIKVPDGPLTEHLQKIRVGDTVLMRKKPTGTLVNDALLPGRRVYMFSTGTGIAPFASLVRDPETYEKFDEVILTHTCREVAELAYGVELVRNRLNDPPGFNVGQVGGVLVVTADGRTLVAADLFPDGSHGSGVMAFDLTTGSPKWARPVRANPTLVLDDRNQRVIAQEAGPGSSRAFTYDLSTGERLETIYDTQHGTLCNMTVTADSRRLLMTSCNDASVGEWALDGATPAGPALSEPGWMTGWNLWDFGTQVAMYDPGGQLHLRGLSTDALVPAPDGLNLDAWSWFLSDGRLMNVFPARDQVVVYDANLANPIRFAADIPDQPNAMAWSRDGSVLVVGAGDNDDIVVIDVPGQREKFRLHTGDGRSLGLDVTPDGSRLFAGSDSEVAAVFDLSTGERVGSLTGVANTTVSPDGTLVAGSSFDGTITFWSTRTFQRVGQPLSGSTSFSNSIQFTFDGRLLITSGLDNTQRIWDVAARRQIGPEIPVEEWTVAIAADSTRIAFNHADGVRLMDIDRDRLRAAACRVAGRALTQDEWRQYIGGTPAQMCASVAVTGLSLTSTPD